VGNDVVWMVVNMKTRLFDESTPLYYFATSDCSGTAMMYVDLMRWGSVTGSTLKYPQGDPTPMIYHSIQDVDGCSQSTNEGSGQVDTFAPAGTASLAQFLGPFKVSK
jgi:hypothetical protein